jgi:putative DNA primase/helicase
LKESESILGLSETGTGTPETAESSDDDDIPFNESEWPLNMPLKSVKSSEILKSLVTGQDGDADLYAMLFKNKYLFDHAHRVWYYWNDHYWREDSLQQNIRSIDAIISLYKIERKRQKTRLEKGKLTKEKADQVKKTIELLTGKISKLHNLRYKEHVLIIASSGVRGIGIKGDQWDQKILILPVANGCVDLQTGEFYDGVPEDYARTAAPTRWEGIDIRCPKWIKFLHSVFGDDAEGKAMVKYIHHLFGYAITGRNTDGIYPILWGERGRNGKSTIINVMDEVLGEFCTKVPQSFFVEGSTPHHSGHDAYTVELQGKRIVWCSETSKRDIINTQKIKDYTGKEKITARAPYGRKSVKFKPTCLFMIITNRRLQMPADDDPLWDRTHLVPFNYTFIDNPNPSNPFEKKRSLSLADELKEEYSGILAWLVRGAIEWKRAGKIEAPGSIVKATKEYRAREDRFAQFIEENFYRAEGHFITKKKLYDIYKSWMDSSKYTAEGRNKFYERFKKIYGEEVRVLNDYGYYGFVPQSECKYK